MTAKRENEVNHSTAPDDRVLNIAQLRSTGVLLTFRHPRLRYPDTALPLKSIVAMGIKNRAALELEVAKKKLDSEKKKAATVKRKQQTQKNKGAAKTKGNQRVGHNMEVFDTPQPGTPRSLHPDARLRFQEVS